ncbi:MAG: hypothetical protein Q7R82_01640 [Candidatus Daviesbacteria bacterium]|nr:hypothetical protein [Candidatus Daviesbacteria bacterium]
MTRKEWLIATIIIFVTVLAWVIFDIIHTRSQVEIPQKTKQIIEPISPDFNIKSLETQP